MASPTAIQDATTTGRLRAIDDDGMITLEVPGSSYQLKLICEATVKTPLGKRITGTINAQALRMHPMAGGGRFIEPVWGEPRIVAGSIQQIDAANNRALINVGVPMWVECPPGQDFDILHPGAMATFYVRSGTRFTPA